MAVASPSEIITPQDLFVAPAVQIENVKRGNAARNWGFTDDDFAALPQPPPIPSLALVAVVLVPYFDSIQRTFDELWDVIAHANPGADRPRVFDDLRSLSLLDGVCHEHGIRWEIIDLAAHWSPQRKYARVMPKHIRNPKTSPHAGILAAAAHHRAWLRAMDGKVVPYVLLSGYRKQPWGDAPKLSMLRGRPTLGFEYEGYTVDPFCAIPEWVEYIP